jgi:tetratricopeptide (TPR) repeat protein
LGTIEFAMTDYSDALRTLLRAKQMSPTSSQTQVEFLLKRTADESECLRLTTAAQLAFKKHDPVQAGDLFSAAWRLHPERADIGFAAVTSYLATSQSNRSLPILNVLSLSPSSNVAQRAEAIRSALADIDRSIYERHRKAQEVLKGIASRYKSPEDLTDLSAKKLATLEHDTQQVLLIAPNLVEAHRLLAFCLMRERKYTQAIDQYRAVLTINPKARVNFWLAWALWKNNQLADARIAVKADMANPTRVDSSLRATLLDELQL